MLWETLVTDGHVRAARLRRIQPWMIAAGFLLLWIGWLIVGLAPQIHTGESAVGKLQERASKLQQHAAATFAALPPLALDEAQQQALPPLSEVAEVVAATLQELTKSGDLPDGDIEFKEIESEALWRGDWGTQRVNYVESGDVYLVAANVRSGSQRYVQPARWVGMFKQFKGQWQYVSIGGGNLFVPREYPYAAPNQLALTLEDFLPEPPEPPEEKQP